MKKTIGIILALVLVLFPASLSAFAAPSPGDVPVEGTIKNTSTGGPDIGDDNTYNIQIPASVKFFVTQNTFPNVYNVDATTDTPNPNSIINNDTTGIAYKVCLLSFVQDTSNNTDAATLSSILTLNLTGSLVDGTTVTNTTNFAPGTFTNSTYYSTQLVKGTPWTFGFGGSVPSTYSLNTTGLFPEYTMNLEFDFA